MEYSAEKCIWMWMMCAILGVSKAYAYNFDTADTAQAL